MHFTLCVLKHRHICRKRGARSLIGVEDNAFRASAKSHEASRGSAKVKQRPVKKKIH